jgi:ribosomal protein L37AE/L43A
MSMISGENRRGSSGSETHASAPAACPVCRSADVKTTAKNIDASTYWRCGRCGEVWNVGRREAGRRHASRW